MGSVGVPKRPYTALIAGAGIGGLSAAIGLSRKGVDVTILEGKSELNEFGASIGISPHAVRVIKSYGLEEQFRPNVTENRYIDMRAGADNRILGAVFTNERNTSRILYGEPAWTIHRADYQQLLARGALGYGARILFNAQVTKVDVDTNTVYLADGRTLTADLVVGADGVRSVVRASIPATASAELIPLNEKAYRCSVDKASMVNHPNLAWLLKNHTSQLWLMSGKYVLSWPMPPHKPYDVVVCVGDGCNVPYGYWGIKADPKQVADEFGDACPTIRDLLANIGPCIQWRFAELPPLKTCRSDKGGVVLLGDAWHAMLPHAGVGGSTAIEDGAVLAECIRWAWENDRPISEATKAYEAIRRPRVERIQAASREGVRFLNGENAEMRDAMLAEQLEMERSLLARPEEERRKDPKPPADMSAPFLSPSFFQWLFTYDAVRETQAYLLNQ
ncbi:FAD dependent oxidoreductase domain containing protein [Cladophialophora carrionii]|uniref:FAD dependent oxidoreductase domain containing protein n=1 Tax=Cladophialophora carrionii TaxID=86049 RepID=A0A1C1CBE5_9EURO|nr:FAD dependent oxidoreductase domain containing protein [Cladophialophora carrionii]